MEQLVRRLRLRFPDLVFRAGKTFSWSPSSSEISYKIDTQDKSCSWSLLHETSHALLGHKSYSTDIELLRHEMYAWERARTLSQEMGIICIPEDYIQDCLDTYRDWLYARSICPACTAKALQISTRLYRCLNCHCAWNVTQSRFCRSYRTTRSTTTIE